MNGVVTANRQRHTNLKLFRALPSLKDTKGALIKLTHHITQQDLIHHCWSLSCNKKWHNGALACTSSKQQVPTFSPILISRQTRSTDWERHMCIKRRKLCVSCLALHVKTIFNNDPTSPIDKVQRSGLFLDAGIFYSMAPNWHTKSPRQTILQQDDCSNALSLQKKGSLTNTQQLRQSQWIR